MESRIDLAKYFNTLGYKRGAEIGVADGRYAQILCENIDDLEYIGVDPWARYDKNWRTNEQQDAAYEMAKKRLKSYNANLMKMTGLEASRLIEDESLDFVFIDGSHLFDEVMLDIILWSRKVKRGGIVSLHDFCYFRNSGVVQAVNAFTQHHRIEINVISRRQENERDDRQPVVWWVRK